MADKGEPLTEREMQIVQLVARGGSNKDVAAELGLSANTVRVHLRNIFSKLDVQSRNELTVLALRSGWVELQAAAQNAEPAQPDRAEAAATPLAHAVAPLVVAPNPEALPSLARWQRVALVVAGLAVLIGVLAMLPISSAQTRSRSDAADELDVPRANGELLAPGESSRWFLRAPLPAARARAAAGLVDGKAYVVGGEVNQTVSADTLVFDPASNSWRMLDAAKPTPVWNAAAAAVDGRLFVLGGTTADGAATSRVEVLDTRAGEWGAASPLPRATSGGMAAALGDTVYFFGGRSGGETTGEAFALDATTNAWRRIAPLPTPRSLAAAVAADDRIFVVGGFDNGRELATCEVYVPATNSWLTCKPMLIPRGGLGLARVGSSLYAVGGGMAGFVGFNERYDLALDKWTPLETPVTGEWRNVSLVVLPTEFYVIGGYANGRRAPFNYVYEVLNNRTFLPSLSAPKTRD